MNLSSNKTEHIHSTRQSRLIDEIIRLAPLNPNWDADLDEYREYLSKKNDIEELEIILHNKKAFMSSTVDRNVEREIRRMDKAGMFNMGNLSPEHALD